MRQCINMLNLILDGRSVNNSDAFDSHLTQLILFMQHECRAVIQPRKRKANAAPLTSEGRKHIRLHVTESRKPTGAWVQLSDDLLISTLVFLDGRSFAQLSCVCRRLQSQRLMRHVFKRQQLPKACFWRRSW